MADDVSKSGVYCIRNRLDGKRYVGSACVSFRKRWNEHLRHLKKGTHSNRYLQRAWDKYGCEAFEFIILEICAPDDCVENEEDWIDMLKADNPDRGYNICRSGFSRLGTKLTEEHKAKISKASKAQHDEQLIGMYGRNHTKESKQRMSVAQRGNKNAAGSKRTDQFRLEASLRAAGARNPMFGKRFTAEHKARIGAKAKGRKRPQKATKSVIDSIRSRFVRTSSRQSNTAKLAREFNLSPVTVGRIVNGGYPYNG